MGMPTNQKTWSFDVNNGVNHGLEVDDSRELLFALKDAMVNAGWTVVMSSDAVSYGAADYWVDKDDIIWERGSDPRSWIVLRNTNLGPANFEVLLHATCYSSDAYAAQVHFARSQAGFTGGSTTAAPTATDQVDMLGPSTGSSTTLYWVPANVGQKYWHAMWSSDGECFRFIVCMSGNPCTALAFEKMSNPATDLDDADKTFIMQRFAAASASEDRIQASDMYSADGANGTIDGNEVTFYMSQEAYNDIRVTEMAAANPQEGDTWPLMPIGLISTTDNSYSYGRCGEVFDLWWGAETLVTGSTFPADGSKTHIKLGDLVFPWSGDAPLVS